MEIWDYKGGNRMKYTDSVHLLGKSLRHVCSHLLYHMALLIVFHCCLILLFPI